VTPAPPPEPTPPPKEMEHVKIALHDTPLEFYRNENATVRMVGAPNTDYYLSVFYKNESKAGGLGKKTSNSSGEVSWTFKVGGNATEDVNFYFTITGGGETETYNFTVIDRN
jgi:hypothetical protein